MIEMKEQQKYNESLKKVTGISNYDAILMSNLISSISKANKNGLQLLKIQLKVHQKYIKVRLRNLSKK